MIPSRWNTCIHGGVAFARDNTIVTTPRFGDGDWRGGWWARYDLETGNCLWKVKHRRGAYVCDLADDVIVATTHKRSGVYAISLATGARLWARLGDRFNWLLKACDYLPADNEGMAPQRIWRNNVLTRCGRLLDIQTGRIVSRHHLEYSESAPITLLKVDGEEVAQFDDLGQRECYALYEYSKEPAVDLLKRNHLALAGYGPCVVRANGKTLCVACTPPEGFESDPNLRFSFDGSNAECAVSLVVADEECSRIQHQYPLGNYYCSEFDWADDSFFSVTAQTFQQRQWTYQRDFWLFDWHPLA